MMTTESKRWRDLLKLINGLEKLHGELSIVMDAKIKAMKRSDLSTMRTLGHQEQALIERIREREGLRRQLVECLGVDLGWSIGKAKSMTLRQLLSAATNPIHDDLRTAADKLRTTMFQLTQISRVAGTVAREITHHMQCVFAAIRPKQDDPTAYTGAGVLASPIGSNMFEVVG